MASRDTGDSVLLRVPVSLDLRDLRTNRDCESEYLEVTPSIDRVTVGMFFVGLLLTAASGIVFSRWHTHGRGGLEEWGLGGRQFGTLVTWFLLGGDFYTAYTIIAVPSL